MPVATSSRRKPTSRRLNSEDIEDVRNTQASRKTDDVSDAEDRPRTGKKVSVKREKDLRRRSNGKQRADPEAEDENDEDEDDRIDVENFPDQPLRRDDLQKLQGLSKEWITMRDRVSKRSELYEEVAAAMVGAGEKDVASSKELQKLDNGVKEFMDVVAEMNCYAQSLDALYQKAMSGTEIRNALSQYKAGVEERKDEYASKTTRQKYLNKVTPTMYSDFHLAIWNANNPDNPMPPLTEMIPKEDGDDSGSDDDVEMGGVTQNYNCPITLTLLENPCTSRICGHSFSASSIKDHFRSGPSTKKCPAAGCNQTFKLDDCQPNKKLAKAVETYKRLKKVNERVDDAEEVVD
ncbi:E3 SUMO-protein ligase NSE2 [Psilocybe cubensis]|uniref:E3 SUMO-protein ligase NSE2 n=1 Tax=Psilocybe cubensis TaxID=181762 RepID=A0ACB8GYG0_PSICU|nr:E3 SUMO-protein ligase NSE2 [Psilocybe cubensis]KAH9480472.1 E3 SUMO-protein ligase NSE2 [Psilocybe cubensis]